MKLYKRIIAVFCSVVMCFSLCFTSVMAAWYNTAGYIYTQSSLASFLVSSGLTAAGAYFGGPVGAFVGGLVSSGIYDLASWLAAGYTEDDFYSVESDYFVDLFQKYSTYSVSSSGKLVFHLTGEINESSDPLYIEGDISHFCVYNADPSTYSGYSPYVSYSFVAPFAGTYEILNENGYYYDGITPVYGIWRLKADGPALVSSYVVNRFVSAYAGISPYNSAKVSSAGILLTLESFCSTGSSFLSASMYLIYSRSGCEPIRCQFPYELMVELTSLETIELPDASTRPSSVMQTINNYNSEDNSTNYYIGTIDDSGTVNNVYDIDIYNEETKVFTEPVTGAQYLTTGWIYDYDTRTYVLSLEEGTFLIGDSDIDTIYLTYGDDELTISYYADNVLIQTDTFAYVIATDVSDCPHDYSSVVTTPATCTSPGVMTYTCSICGHTYTEEIPQTDHVYTYETTKDPSCIDPGERVGTCSECGNEIIEDLPALGHDWLETDHTPTTYALPEDAACPSCGSSAFTYTLNQSDGTYSCTCSDCGKTWTEQSVITYGQTTYTCSRCGETYTESEDGESGLFASIGNFIANGIGWIVDKLKQLIDSFSSINDIFSSFIQNIKEKTGTYPFFLAAVVECLPEDLMTVIWFAVVAVVVLLVWKKWFH